MLDVKSVLYFIGTLIAHRDVFRQKKKGLKKLLECGIYGDGAYRFWVGKLEGKRPPGITGHRWQNNIKIDFKERFWNVVTAMVTIELW